MAKLGLFTSEIDAIFEACNETVYYSAPNCNAICSSGSGTPKANGTQDCSCQSARTSTDTKCWENYDDIGCYININTSYRDNNSVTISTTCDNHGCYSNIDFRNAPKDQSNIVVKINGTKYEFLANDRGCGLTDAKSWCLDNDISIIEESKNYTIEFLN